MSAELTPRDVKSARGSMSTKAFAGLLGVDHGTVYRWEAPRMKLAIEPMQRSLIAVLVESTKTRPSLRDELELAVSTRGSMYALYVLLRAHFSGASCA